MGMMDRMRERMEELERQEAQKRQKELKESRQRYRPEPDSLPLSKARWIYGAYTLFAWIAFLGLTFVNNRGFWARYVLLPYLALSVPLLLYTRGWIQMLFMEDGEMTVKTYRKSIGQCKGSLIGLMVVWIIAAAMNGLFILLERPVDTGKEFIFLVGCLAAAGISRLAQNYTNRVLYTLWNLDDPVLE